MKEMFRITLLTVTLLTGNIAMAEDTPAQIPVGIAIGPGGIIEVNFPNMTNTQSCNYSGAYVIDPSLSVETKQMMLSTLLTAKATNQRVRVRLNGCTDRPKIVYVFYEASWVGGF